MTSLRWGVASDVGRVRTTNQDRALVLSDLFAVADGMGGHQGGDVAAEIAVAALQDALPRRPALSELREAVAFANRAVWERSIGDESLRGMGTTLTAIAMVTDDGGDLLGLVNVGDSRGYLFTSEGLQQLTDDHSLVEEMVRSGEISPEEATAHPARHILTRVLGVEPDVEVDSWKILPRQGDRILLCSDGLINEVDNAEIAEVLGSLPDPEAAADELVRRARAHGGSDNITVLVLDVQGDPVAGAGNALAGTVAQGGSAASAGTVAQGGSAAADGAGAGGSSAAGGPAGSGAGTRRARARVEPLSDPRGPARVGTLAPPLPRDPVRAAPWGPVPAQPASRRFTFRVLGFCVLLALVMAGAVGAVYWYADNTFTVVIRQGAVVIEQGRPGGTLWLQPHVVDASTAVTPATVPSSALPALEAGVTEPSLAAARSYVANLRAEYASLNPPTRTTAPARNAKAPSSTTATTRAGTSATTAPPKGP